MIKQLSGLLEVDTMDAIDARRRRLLNILLAGASALSIMIILLTLIVDAFSRAVNPEDSLPIFVIGSGIFLASIGIYAVNRFRSGWVASLLFLMLWTLVLPFSDAPKEVADGRSLFAFAIPIVMASVLLHPSSSFLFAGLVSIEISVIALSISEIPNFPAVLGFFLIALVSWLSARSLENALAELILVNQELDKRVVDRTRALTESLARERAEAGRNQAILQDIADGVIVFDTDGRAMMVNSAMVTLTGSPAESILGLSVAEWLAGSGLAETERRTLENLFNIQSAGDGKPRVQWGKKTVVITVAPVRTSGGETIGQVAVFHDFTHEAEVDRMKSDFVAMVSHELRTPLSSILGYADMLHEGVYGKMEDRQSGVIERIIANTNKLLVIVNDLLDQAQIDAGRLTLHNRHFKPGELLENVRQVMDNIVREKQLKLITTCAEDLPRMLYGDPQRLNQVMVNLVSNAVKFTEKGQVEVRLSRVDEAHWSIEIRDSGVGIPDEAQKVIFDPFRQVDMGVTRRPAGIGLGLSIVKRMVELMHGEICLTSQVGRGSTFTVILPIDALEKEMV